MKKEHESAHFRDFLEKVLPNKLSIKIKQYVMKYSIWGWVLTTE